MRDATATGAAGALTGASDPSAWYVHAESYTSDGGVRTYRWSVGGDDEDAPSVLDAQGQGHPDSGGDPLLAATARSSGFERTLHIRRREYLDARGDWYSGVVAESDPGVPCNGVPRWFASLDELQTGLIGSLPETDVTLPLLDMLDRVNFPDPPAPDSPVRPALDPMTVVRQIPAFVATLGSLHLVARVLATGTFSVSPDGADKGTYTVTVKCDQRFHPERAEAVADHLRQLTMSAYTQANPAQFAQMAEVMFQLGITQDAAAEARVSALTATRREIEVLVARLASRDPRLAPHELAPYCMDSLDPVVRAAEHLQRMIAQMAGDFEHATRQDIGATWLYRRVLAQIVSADEDIDERYAQVMSDFPLGRYGVHVDQAERAIKERIDRETQSVAASREAAIHRIDELQERLHQLGKERARADDAHRAEVKQLKDRLDSHERATAAAILERDTVRREADVLRVTVEMRDETIARMSSQPAEAVLRQEIESLRRVNASLAGDQRARSVAHAQLVESEQQAAANAKRLGEELREAQSRARSLSHQLQSTATRLADAEDRYTKLYAAAYPTMAPAPGDTLTDSDGGGSVADPDGLNRRFTMLEID